MLPFRGRYARCMLDIMSSPEPADLIPTNLPGAFWLPLPPELAGHARIAPDLRPRPAVTHIRRAARRYDRTDGTSTNWSGVSVSGTWNTVAGTWVVPEVFKPAQPEGSEGGWHCTSWVGLDGLVSDDDVLQAGVGETIDGFGIKGYYVWYEWFSSNVRGAPGYINETVFADVAVGPGDTVTCTIQYIGEVSPVAAPGSALDGYPTEYDSQHHVNYLDVDGNVHEFYFDGSRWQHSNLTEHAGATDFPAAPGSSLHGYATEYNQQEHVNFLGADGNVHELVDDGGGWKHNDLTAIAAGAPPPAAPGSPLAGYSTEYNSQEHVNYLDAAGNVHELFFDGSGWQHNNLTAIAAGSPPPAAPGSAIDGYSTEYNSQQHVNYLDAAGNVHELFFDGSGWQHNNLTAIAAGSPPPAAPGSAIDGYSTEYNSQQHVNYLDAAGNVHELYFDGNRWQHNDLSAISFGTPPPAAAGSPLVGYPTEFNSQQHVNFLDGVGNVHELYFDGSRWQHNNLTGLAYLLSAKTTGVTGVRGQTLDGYATEFNSQQHVSFLDPGGHVRELYYDDDGHWHEEDLTLLADAATEVAAPGSALDGYSTEYNSQQHVNYLDAAGNVHELFYDGRDWLHNNLTVVSKSANDPAAPGSALDGYSTEYNSRQHVNYLDAAGNVHELANDGGGWRHSDLLVLAGASSDLAAPGSALDGYSTEYNSQEHVNYLDAAGNVHELFNDGSGWKHNNLTTTAAGAPPPAAPGSSLHGYPSEYNSQQHVNYLDAAGDVHELFFDGSSWQHNNLTALASGSPPPAAPGSALHGYSTEYNSQQHVNYLDAAGDVHELFFDGSSWQHNNLSMLSGGHAAVPGSPLDGYQAFYNSQQHVNYLDSSGNVHELYNDGNGWQHNNLSADAYALDGVIPGAPVAIGGSALDGYPSVSNRQQHVNYLDASGHVHEVYYAESSGPLDGPAGWVDNDLTLFAGRSGKVTFANLTANSAFSLFLLPPPGASFLGESAEWIMEAPDSGEPISSLPKFGETTFTQAMCSGPVDVVSDPVQGEVWNISGFGETLTSVTVAPNTVTIDFIGG